MQKDSRLLRIGVLGCGPISQFAHFDACRKARNAELYAICDVAEDLVARMAAVHHPTVTYTNYEAMLADPQVEAVIIGVADQYHVELCGKALDAGKHVLVEKPLGVTIEECETLCGRVAESGRVIQVGHNRRFDPGVMYAKQFIDNEMGERLAMRAWYCDSTYRYTMTDNLQPIPETSGSIRRPGGNPKADKRRYFMLTHGSHLVDTARLIGGPILSVRTRLTEKFGAYCWFVDVEFADGSAGHLDLTVAVRGDFLEGFQIYGEEGMVTCHLNLPWFHKAAHVECFSVKDGAYRRPLGEDAYSYKRQVEGFAETILNGAPQYGANVEDGLAGMRAMVAITRSVETGDPVRLADVTGGI